MFRRFQRLRQGKTKVCRAGIYSGSAKLEAQRNQKRARSIMTPRSCPGLFGELRYGGYGWMIRDAVGTSDLDELVRF